MTDFHARHVKVKIGETCRRRKLDSGNGGDRPGGEIDDQNISESRLGGGRRGRQQRGSGQPPSIARSVDTVNLTDRDGSFRFSKKILNDPIEAN